MDWSKGYSARYYASILDKATLRDIPTGDLKYPRLEIISGTVKRTSDALRESANITCRNYQYTTEQYIRIWLDAKQNGTSSHIPLFTGLAIAPKKQYNGNKSTSSVECYSLLKIANDILLPRGWYAPAEVDGPTIVKDLLKVIGTKISIANIESESRVLTQAILAESGETNLSMCNVILDTIGWNLRIDGYGNISLEPINDDPLITFDSNQNDVIEQSIDIENDYYSCPNILRAVVEDVSAVFKDERENSSLSIQNRGREIWYEETNCYLNDGESISDYARRRLFELQQASTAVSYDRRYHPDIRPMDVIRLNYPAQSLFGDFRVSTQSITLGYNAKTSEEVYLL